MEVDGPWWGEREAAYLRQLAAVGAAAGGTSVSPDEFKLDWHVGPSDAPPANLLSPDDGLAIFAARHGLELSEAPA